MTLYTFDFGFNLNSAQIGTLPGNPIPQLPLQLNMVDESTGQAAWPTQLMTGDEIRFRVTDITSAEGDTPESVPDTWTPSGPVQGYVPIRLEVFTADLADDPLAPFVDTSVPVLQFLPSSFHFQSAGPPQSAVYNAINPDWKLAIWYVNTWTNTSGQYELVDMSAFYKFSFLLEVRQDSGESKTFIVDPEMFVGGGDEGD